MKNLLINGSVAGCLLMIMLACNQRPSKTISLEDTLAHGSMIHEGMPVTESVEMYTKAVCVLQPTKGNQVTGIVTFTQSDSGMVIIADLEGLTAGKHGFHVHQYGDCSSPDGSSAGGHFNPEKKDHGAPHSNPRHVGDLGNLEAGKDGKVHYQIVDSLISLNGSHSIIGRALVVHAGEDDLKSQPSGNSGSRVACGVIGIAP